MGEGTASFEIIHLTTFVSPLAGEVGPEPEPLELVDDAVRPHLTLLPITNSDSTSAVTRSLNIGREVEIVRWRAVPSAQAQDDVHLEQVADASDLAKQARRVAQMIEHEKDNSPQLEAVRSHKRVLDETAFVFAVVCTDIQRHFADTFVQKRFGLSHRALKVADQQIPTGITVWKDDSKRCFLVLADPTVTDQQCLIRSDIRTGELDRLEAWWHLTRQALRNYREIVNGNGDPEEKDQGLFALRDVLRDKMSRLADDSTADREASPERLVTIYHKINGKATKARELGLNMRTFQINMEDEVAQLSNATAAIARSRIRDTTLPQEQIILDLATVHPQLETANAFLSSDMGEHMGVLTLFIVPLAMMQVVLAILQICWTVAHDTESSWMHPVWDAFAHVTPIISLVIAAACAPGIWYSLRFARKHHRMRKVGVVAILLAVLVFLIPLAAVASWLLSWLMALITG